MPAHRNGDKRYPRPHEILYRGLVWAFVGALYAAMFVPVFEVTNNVLPFWIAPVFATIAATAGGALVYSSAQLAIQTAIFSNIAVFAYLLSQGVVVSPLGPTLVGAGVGTVTGGVYGLLVKESKIYRAEAKLMAGIVAGGAASIIGLVWVVIVDDKLVWLIALLAPMSGMIYLKLTASFVERFSDVLPPVGDGAVAGLVIGAFVGFGLWLGGAIALEKVVPEWHATFDRIKDIGLLAIAVASVTTFVMGMVKTALRLNWGDPYDQ